MNETFKKLAKEISFNVSKSFQNVELTKAELVKVTGKDEQVFELIFDAPEIIPFHEMITFLISLNNFKYKARPIFNSKAQIYEHTNSVQYLVFVLKQLLQHPELAMLIKESNLKIDNELKKIEIIELQPEDVKAFMLVQKQMTRSLRNLGFNDVLFDFALTNEIKEIIHNEKSVRVDKVKKFTENSASRETQEVTKNKKWGFIAVDLDDLKTSDIQKVKVDGEVFDIQSKQTKKENLWVVTIQMTNYKDAVTVKRLCETDDKTNIVDSIVVGTYITVFGNYGYDNYAKEEIISASKITKTINPKKATQDNEDEKRVELICRTKMTTMDGIVSPKAILKRAVEWGHSAIGVADVNSVQSFPNLYNDENAKNIKVLYGATFTSVDEDHKIIRNHRENVDLLSDTYIVFDLETTGLSPIFDEIIEFGAVKFENGVKVGQKQFFVKPIKEISEKITSFTGIDHTNVKDAPSEKDAMKMIHEYINGYSLVAHNASFDIAFINEKFENNGIKRVESPVIDTLVISRMLDPTKRSHNLKEYSKRHGESYDTVAAHRADYDAEILGKAFMRSLTRLKEMGIENQDQLANYTNDVLYAKAFPNEITVMAKNQKGLKTLFESISYVSTDNFHGGPKIFKSNIPNNDDILKGSGGLNSMLIEKLFRATKKDVIEEIAFYDFITIPAPMNFKHYLGDGLTQEELHTALAFLIDEAKKQNKIVVASSEVKYLDPLDKMSHNICVYAKGIGGRRHKLYYPAKNNIELPDQHLLNTKEMKAQFLFLDSPKLIHEIVIGNTNKIADMIDKITIIKKDLYTPKIDQADAKLEEFVYKNARRMYGEKLPPIVEARIEREIGALKKYGFSVIYWISHLLVKKSLDDGYLVGSRGSVGSSLVATLSNITEVNPLDPHYYCLECNYFEVNEDEKITSGFDLPTKECPNCKIKLLADGQKIPFETFLGFEADKVPDIDLNFSGEYQSTIHDEVKKIFGEKHSFRAGTISTIAERTAFGYVLNWEEETNQSISKPFKSFLARKIEGVKRTTGQHPGGIIVIPSEYDVEDFTPINYPANDVTSAWKTTHLDFHAIHDNVLKLDLLGHDDPTAIRFLQNLTGVDPKSIPMHDEKLISLFSSPEALGIKPEDIAGERTGIMGIPEFGTQFVRRMLYQVDVKSFADLISVSGLSHGTDVWTNNAEQLVKTRGLELSELISCRDDIMNALILKGVENKLSFDIMERVRKGRSITDVQEKVLIEHKVEDWYIGALKKIQYMFPKAHATAYVMMAWRVAWFKLYHPIEYYATYLTTRADVSDVLTTTAGKQAVMTKLEFLSKNRNKRGEDKLSNKEIALIPILEIVNEGYARGINFKKIDIEISLAHDWKIDKETNSLYPPFSSVDGLGEAVAQSVIQARNEKPFTSIVDIKKRTSINKTSMAKLIEMDVFEGIPEDDQMSLF